MKRVCGDVKDTYGCFAQVLPSMLCGLVLPLITWAVSLNWCVGVFLAGTFLAMQGFEMTRLDRELKEAREERAELEKQVVSLNTTIRCMRREEMLEEIRHRRRRGLVRQSSFNSSTGSL